jgi:hypothetical protein
MIGMAAVAALAVVAMTATAENASAQAAAAAQPAAKKAKAYKDTAEYDAYNDVIKDSLANPPNAKKFLADLDSWTQKYPNSDYKDIRSWYYVQAYAANNEIGKALDTAKALVDLGPDGLKDALDSDNAVLSFLVLVSRAAAAQAAAGTATPDQIATGTKTAQLLTDFGKAYFAPEKKPANRTADEWAQGLKLVTDQAQVTQFQIALFPGASILKKNPTDAATCAAAEEGFKKTLQQYPDSGSLAMQLAAVSRCQQSVTPAKVQQALYLYARALVLPVGGMAGLDANAHKALDDCPAGSPATPNQAASCGYLKKIYTAIHGSDEGLAQLKELAAKSPLPPPDFHIKTATEIAAAQEEEFKAKYPQLAMWLGIKGQLADTNGQQYFDGTLKESDMSGPNGTKLLKGTLMSANPACRPKELLVAIPLPDQQGTPVPEITLKLVAEDGKPAPLTGKVETGGQIQFNGVPSAFTKEPFMLTLDTDKSKIDGLNVTPCAPPPARKGAPPAKKKAGE